MIYNVSTYYLSHYNEKDNWRDMVGNNYHPSIQVDNWDRVEVSSRSAGFGLLINDEVVDETIDNRYARGNMALIVDEDEAPARIQFDNFGF